jgi:integrase
LLEAEPFLSDPKSGVLEYLAWSRAQGNCDRTLSNKSVRLGAFFKWAGMDVPVPSIKFVSPMPKIYSIIDLEKFFSACDRRQYIFHRFLLVTGCRMAECMHLEWSDIHDGCVHIQSKPGWTPKTSEERMIPLPGPVAEMLSELKCAPKCSLVFPSRLGNIDFHMLRTTKLVAARAGLNPADWSLHGFRRTCITTLLRNGLDLRTVMAIAGHSSMESTMRYLRPMEGQTLQDKIAAIWA